MRFIGTGSGFPSPLLKFTDNLFLNDKVNLRIKFSGGAAGIREQFVEGENHG
jgi:hypothetical protein